MTNPNNPNAQAVAFENGNGTTQANGNDAQNSFHFDPSSLSLEELETLRTQEITAKAASGLLLLVMKWFKVSRPFEAYNIATVANL